MGANTMPPSPRASWTWFLLLAATIFYASGGAAPKVPRIFSFQDFDKWAHFFIFGLLALLALRAMNRCAPTASQALLAWLLATLFGVGDELHQFTNPHRTFDTGDMLADTLGAALACASYACWTGFRRAMEFTTHRPAGDNTGTP